MADSINLHGQQFTISFTDTTIDSEQQLAEMLRSASDALAKEAWARYQKNQDVAFLDDINININTGDWIIG